MRLSPAWFDGFFILRPTLFFPAWTAFLAGYHRGEGADASRMWLLLWLTCASGAAFILNQLADRREDQQNGKLLPLWGHLISRRFLYLELIILFAATLAGGMLAGGELFGLLISFFVVAGLLYNLPPWRLKNRPVLGIVACSAGGLLLFFIGARAALVDYSTALIAGLPYLLAGAGASLLTHVPDLPGDRRAGVRTFPLAFSLHATGAWALTMVLASAILSLYLSDYVLLISAAAALPFFLRFYLQRTSEAAELAVKVAIFSLAMMVGITWYPFLIMIAVYYPFARWYHRARLGLDYPTFRSLRTAPANFSAAKTDLLFDSAASPEKESLR